MPPNNQSAVGAAAVRQAYDAVFKAIKLDLKFTVAEVVQIAPAAGQEPEFASGRAYYTQGEFKKAVAYFQLALKVTRMMPSPITGWACHIRCWRTSLFRSTTNTVQRRGSP